MCRTVFGQKKKSGDCAVRSKKLQVFSCILEQNFHCGKLLVEAICLLSAKIIFAVVHQQYFLPSISFLFYLNDRTRYTLWILIASMS